MNDSIKLSQTTKDDPAMDPRIKRLFLMAVFVLASIPANHRLTSLILQQIHHLEPAMPSLGAAFVLFFESLVAALFATLPWAYGLFLLAVITERCLSRMKKPR